MAKTLKDDLKKRHGFASLRQEAYLNLARTQAELSAGLAALLKAHGLSEATYNILRILRGVDRFPVAGRTALPCGEVAERMVTRVPDVTRLMDRLEKAELIERVRCEDDRRVVRAQISPAGRALLRKLTPKVDRAEQAMFPALTDRELATLSRLLEKSRATASAKTSESP
ncbi:MAG: MarR family winged helix-turn-helix transcriptional regulator [Phycisphaerales bacterium JB063]